MEVHFSYRVKAILDCAVPGLLLDADGLKIRRDVLVDFEPKRFSDPHPGRTAEDEHYPCLRMLPPCES